MKVKIFLISPELTFHPTIKTENTHIKFYLSFWFIRHIHMLFVETVYFRGRIDDKQF